MRGFVPKTFLLFFLVLSGCAQGVDDPLAAGTPPKTAPTECPEGVEVGEGDLCGIPPMGAAEDLDEPEGEFEEPTLDNSDIEAQSAYFLTQEGDGKFFVYVNETIEVGVRAIDQVGRPVEPGHRVAFEIVAVEGAAPSESHLGAAQSATNEFGVAHIQLTGGSRPEFFNLEMVAENTTSLT